MIINTEGNVDLGAMNALLLEEVEELTLCVIDLQGRMDSGGRTRRYAPTRRNRHLGR
jgi:hypothetical protein